MREGLGQGSHDVIDDSAPGRGLDLLRLPSDTFRRCEAMPGFEDGNKSCVDSVLLSSGMSLMVEEVSSERWLEAWGEATVMTGRSSNRASTVHVGPRGLGSVACPEGPASD